jgi:hypothetical protein
MIGILSAPDAEGMIAKPEGGNFGCVVDGSQVEISEETLQLLKNIPKGHDSLGEIDVFKADDGRVIFGWIGGYMTAFPARNAEASREYDPKLLTATAGVVAPQDFIDYVESEIAEGNYNPTLK